MRRTVLLIALAFGLVAPSVRAQGAADVAAFKAAAGLAADGDWLGAEAAVAGSGALARALVRWMRLRDGPAPVDAAPDPRDPDPVFADYAAFVAAHAHWPGLDRLRREGERTIPPQADPSAVAAWFEGAAPQTGEGAAALARALVALGRAEEARAVAVAAWLGIGLSPEGQAALLADWSGTLIPLAPQRAEAMLWRWRTGDAERVLSMLPEDRRLLAEARIALLRDAPDRGERVAAVPAALRDDPGLAVDRFNRLADDGDYTDAVALLLERTGDPAQLGDPFRWASWRATLARWAMREGRADEAYRLASAHHLTEGDLFADLEWVAGYVALRYLNDPATALVHFRRMEPGVTGPVSLSRAAYWTARAEEAAGNPDAAAQAYGRAAQHQTAFYGLLAAERLGLPLDPALIGTEDFGDWRQGTILGNDLVAALLMLLAADARNEAVLFALKLGQTLDRDQLGQLGALLSGMGEVHLALVASKEAGDRGILIPAMQFPVHPLAGMDLPVAPELALAIARQESEFNSAAGSAVGALGLMQLMPATAEEVAGDLGLPFERSRLTRDWAYNATLGARYLADLQETFGPTPVMIAAGYNAGPSRPRAWMTQRGDPRIGEADVIDWIEHIPFAETRNYVMRVTEAMPVYRARLSGQVGPVQFLALLQGARPLVRPQARPGRTLFAVDDAVAAALAEPVPHMGPPTQLAPVQALRPVARP